MPAGPSLSYLPAPLCHTCRLLSVCLPALLCHARRPPSVIPAVFSGNPVKTVFLQGSIRESYSFDKASMDSESLLDAQCRKSPARNNSGFPITNVGNDRRGSLVGNDRRSFVGNNRRGSFRMGERGADDVRDENHEATGFFQRMAKSRRPPRHSRRGPSLSCPPAPLCHACRSLSVMPVGLLCHSRSF